MAPYPSVLLLVIGLLASFTPASAQNGNYQYGSFFTAIYISPGASVENMVPCAGMGYNSYCCSGGQYCALDGNSAIACCAQGATCQGKAGAGNNGQYVPPSSSWAPSSTLCGCESDPTSLVTVTTQNNVVPVVYNGVTITVTTTEGYQPLTTTATAYSTPTTLTTQGLIVTSTSTTTGPVLITTAEGIVTTPVNNPGTCGSFSTIIAQGNNLPATRNCIVFISWAAKTRGLGMEVVLGLLTVSIWTAFVLSL